MAAAQSFRRKKRKFRRRKSRCRWCEPAVIFHPRCVSGGSWGHFSLGYCLTGALRCAVIVPCNPFLKWWNMDGDIYSRGLNSRVYLAVDFIQYAGHIHIAPLWLFMIFGGTSQYLYMVGSSIVKELYHTPCMKQLCLSISLLSSSLAGCNLPIMFEFLSKQLWCLLVNKNDEKKNALLRVPLKHVTQVNTGNTNFCTLWIHASGCYIEKVRET